MESGIFKLYFFLNLIANDFMLSLTSIIMKLVNIDSILSISLDDRFLKLKSSSSVMNDMYICFSSKILINVLSPYNKYINILVSTKYLLPFISQFFLSF